MCIPIKEPAGSASSTIGAEDGFSFKKERMMRTCFFQEGKDDEDMTSMHMTKHGEWHEDEGDLQGFPSREEGPKLIRFESPSWRPKTTLAFDLHTA